MAGLLALWACQPALNWREVQLDARSITGMMPCKPEKSIRNVWLGGQDVPMQLHHCKASGATFAVTWANIAQGSSVPLALDHWRRSTLTHLKAAGIVSLPTTYAGRVAASGVSPEGDAVAMVAQWVSHGQQVIQMAIYVDNPQNKVPLDLIKVELRDTFFDGLKFSL